MGQTSKQPVDGVVHLPLEDYSTAYQMAFGWLMGHEGGYTEDHAGATNMGIILRDLEALGESGDVNQDGGVNVDDIKEMTREYAAWFFHQEYWGKYRYKAIEGMTVAMKIFDMAVVMGPRQAHRCAQRACRACGLRIEDDGILGPISRQALCRVQEAVFVGALKSEAAGVMRMIVARTPAREEYLVGWLKRAYA